MEALIVNYNTNLIKAKQAKNDEFYTRYEDIDAELSHYSVEYFRDKVIYCPCDIGIDGLDVPKSNFIKYFENNKERLGYKKLIHTSLQEGFDYRSEYCQKLFKEADVVVTNPPFSLFRDFVANLEKHENKYIIWGNNNAINYKEVFPLIMQQKLWLGYTANKTCSFKVGQGYSYDEKETIKINDGSKYGKVPAISVFTNLDLQKNYDVLLLVKTYNEKDYPKYDNYDAIEVSKIKDIPYDYDGVMGVPLTFISVYNPRQFEIIGSPDANVLPNGWKGASAKIMSDFKAQGNKKHINTGCKDIVFYDKDGKVKAPYARILIRRKQQEVQ
jgi:hypothetical protein